MKTHYHLMYINISEIKEHPERWVYTGDGYRELTKYGNRHAKFTNDPNWLEYHEDLYNATSFPKGTINHLAHWVHEKTGINETVLRGAGWLGLIYFGYRALK